MWAITHFTAILVYLFVIMDIFMCTSRSIPCMSAPKKTLACSWSLWRASGQGEWVTTLTFPWAHGSGRRSLLAAAVVSLEGDFLSLTVNLRFPDGWCLDISSTSQPWDILDALWMGWETLWRPVSAFTCGCAIPLAIHFWFWVQKSIVWYVMSSGGSQLKQVGVNSPFLTFILSSGCNWEVLAFLSLACTSYFLLMFISVPAPTAPGGIRGYGQHV